MANKEQVAILRRGVAAWNQWREENPDAKIDLSAIDLSQLELVGNALWDDEYPWANLRGANLTEANLTEANLTEANLTEANLTKANLTKANLTEANLTKANLTEANLTEANLWQANLWQANMGEANLWKADLRRADFAQADLRRADLGEADLTQAALWEADLTQAALWKADLTQANLGEADLRQADLRQANLTEANLRQANLTEANLGEANLAQADLWKADLTKADLRQADLRQANLTQAILWKADLTAVQLIDTKLEGATLTDCRIYGIAAWNVLTDTETVQRNLIITPYDQPNITVDNLKVAQFLYLIINNPEIRDALNTIHTKVVLILGRFTDARKPVLDALRDRLRQHNYIPVMFDFEKSADKSFIETVSTLANMARFIIADMTDAKLSMQEVQQILSHRPTVPVQPLLLANSNPSIALGDFIAFGSFLNFCIYKDQDDLLESLSEKVIGPAEQRAQELARKRQEFEEMLRLHNTTKQS